MIFCEKSLFSFVQSAIKDDAEGNFDLALPKYKETSTYLEQILADTKCELDQAKKESLQSKLNLINGRISFLEDVKKRQEIIDSLSENLTQSYRQKEAKAEEEAEMPINNPDFIDFFVSGMIAASIAFKNTGIPSMVQNLSNLGVNLAKSTRVQEMIQSSKIFTLIKSAIEKFKIGIIDIVEIYSEDIKTKEE